MRNSQGTLQNECAADGTARQLEWTPLEPQYHNVALARTGCAIAGEAMSCSHWPFERIVANRQSIPSEPLHLLLCTCIQVALGIRSPASPLCPLASEVAIKVLTRIEPKSVVFQNPTHASSTRPRYYSGVVLCAARVRPCSAGGRVAGGCIYLSSWVMSSAPCNSRVQDRKGKERKARTGIQLHVPHAA